jgi:hypothetical protein
MDINDEYGSMEQMDFWEGLTPEERDRLTLDGTILSEEEKAHYLRERAEERAAINTQAYSSQIKKSGEKSFVIKIVNRSREVFWTCTVQAKNKMAAREVFRRDHKEVRQKYLGGGYFITIQ